MRLFQRVTVFLQRHVAVFIALAALDQQVLNTGIERRHRLLAGLPGGAHLVEIGLRHVLHGAQALIAVKGGLVVPGVELRGAQVGTHRGDLRIQLLVAQLCLLKGDLRSLDLIDKWRRIQFVQQVALFHLAIVMYMHLRDVAGYA